MKIQPLTVRFPKETYKVVNALWKIRKQRNQISRNSLIIELIQKGLGMPSQDLATTEVQKGAIKDCTKDNALPFRRREVPRDPS